MRRDPEVPMRFLAFIGVCCLSGWASAANVILMQPTQGQTIPGENVSVVASVTEDFVVGKDGFIEIWVDGSRALTLTGKSGTLKLSPGNHQLQAHLVGPNQGALPIATNSEQVTVTVAQPDPRSP
jgi:hypothetical protein